MTYNSRPLFGREFFGKAFLMTINASNKFGAFLVSTAALLAAHSKRTGDNWILCEKFTATPIISRKTRPLRSTGRVAQKAK